MRQRAQPVAVNKVLPMVLFLNVCDVVVFIFPADPLAADSLATGTFQNN